MREINEIENTCLDMIEDALEEDITSELCKIAISFKIFTVSSHSEKLTGIICVIPFVLFSITTRLTSSDIPKQNIT